MRTLRPRASAPASARPAASEELAPSLAHAKRRDRAKTFSAAPAFTAGGDGLEVHERAVIDAALAILRARLRRPGAYITSPGAARNVLLLHLADREQECFAVLFLSAQHAVIGFEELFRGSLTQTSVYPREVVRAALRHNAAAVVLAHNHPSGVLEPSVADLALTVQIRDALKLVDVQTLDHFIVSGDSLMSFAERGLM